MLKYNGKVIAHSSKWVCPPVNFNPLNLPKGTVRVRTSDGQPPIWERGYTTYASATLVTGTSDQYDVASAYTNSCSLMLQNSTNVIEVLGGNLEGITNTSSMFANTSISSIPLMDTSSVTNMNQMFAKCSNLTYVPVIDTHNVTNMNGMFQQCTSLQYLPDLDFSSLETMQFYAWGCVNLITTILDTYNKAILVLDLSDDSNYIYSFVNAGKNTEQGTWERNQLPSLWRYQPGVS